MVTVTVMGAVTVTIKFTVHGRGHGTFHGHGIFVL
jgi:hypothetical protein